MIILSATFARELLKAKKMPIGTISRGRKKVAEGKWVPVKSGEAKAMPKTFQLDVKKMESIKLPKDIKAAGIDSKEYKNWIYENWAARSGEKKVAPKGFMSVDERMALLEKDPRFKKKTVVKNPPKPKGKKEADFTITEHNPFNIVTDEKYEAKVAAREERKRVRTIEEDKWIADTVSRLKKKSDRDKLSTTLRQAINKHGLKKVRDMTGGIDV